MSESFIKSLKIKAKLLQKAKNKAGKPVQLKEAFGLIAAKAGFSSWREYKRFLENTVDFCPIGTSAYWKVWYASYEEALQHLLHKGGYLLPYQKHFFICEPHYIEALGIASDDPDLDKVGNNWVEPNDMDAWKRLLLKMKA